MYKKGMQIMAKIIRICLLYSLLIPNLITGLACPAEEKPQHSIQSPNKIRAGYMGTWNLDVLGEMAQNGMNVALVKFGRLHWPMRTKQWELLVRWADACEQAGLEFIPVINFWGAEEPKWVKPRYHLFYRDVEYPDTPCPLDADVYKLVVRNRLVELAKLSRQIKIAGAAIDSEMYGANMVTFPDCCLCDYCFERFLAGKAVPKPIPRGQRYDYIVSSGQLTAYKSFMKNSVAQLARHTREQVKSIAPGFKIGAPHLDRPVPYHQGLELGFGSGEQPFYVFLEGTYSKGYTTYIEKSAKRFSQPCVNIKCVVGIWQDKFPPENLAEQYYHCAKDSAGYWIYTMESLAKRSTTRALPFEKKQYWDAIHKANNELDKLAADPGYKSPLKVRSFEAPVKALSFKNMAVKPVEYIRPLSKVDSGIGPTILRFFNKLIFVAKKGDKLEFKIAYGRIKSGSAPYVEVGLISPRGDVLARDKTSFLSNAKLKTEAPYSGNYVIAVESYGNSAKVVGFSHPYSVDTGVMAHFIRPGGSLYLCKPAGSSSAKVTFEVDGIGESVTVTFKNEAGKILGVHDIVSKQTITVPLTRSGEDEIIELKIQPRSGAYFGDVAIRVESGLEKYISPFREAVVKASLP